MKGVALPYWDSVLESALPEPRDSVLWTPRYLGSVHGPLDGPFDQLPVMKNCHSFGKVISRNAAADGGNWLLTDEDIDQVINKTSFADLASDPRFEMDHGGVHQFFGGHMSDLNCATADPIFFLHHAFVDCTFQKFLDAQTPPVTPNKYPLNAPGGSHHQAQSPMTPCLGISNSHGLQEAHYAHYRYTTKPSSVTCMGHKQCGNRNALWCDVRLNPPKCRAKVKTGGNCTGLPNGACQTCKKSKAFCVKDVCICILNSELI